MVIINIELKNLCKSFENNKVLNNVNAIFNCNEINCLLGNSGCGKTTLLNILMGIYSADSGCVLGLNDRKISAVFQEDRLCENMNAIKNIRLVCSKNISDEKIINDLIFIGLKESLYKPISKLSGGMKRRVAIVRALIYNSDILIMDEPFKGLDETTKMNVIEYIKNNTHNRTTILVIHDERDIIKLNINNIITISQALNK